MPLATWPATLPQSWPAEYEHLPIDSRAKFDVDAAGSSKMRRTQTADPHIYRLPEIVLTEEQYKTLDSFWVSTLAGGVRSFEWTDPWVGAGVVRLQFLERPVGHKKRRKWRVPLSFKAFPWYQVEPEEEEEP